MMQIACNCTQVVYRPSLMPSLFHAHETNTSNMDASPSQLALLQIIYHSLWNIHCTTDYKIITVMIKSLCDILTKKKKKKNQS